MWQWCLCSASHPGSTGSGWRPSSGRNVLEPRSCQASPCCVLGTSTRSGRPTSEQRWADQSWVREPVLGSGTWGLRPWGEMSQGKSWPPFLAELDNPTPGSSLCTHHRPQMGPSKLMCAPLYSSLKAGGSSWACMGEHSRQRAPLQDWGAALQPMGWGRISRGHRE